MGRCAAARRPGRRHAEPTTGEFVAEPDDRSDVATSGLAPAALAPTTPTTPDGAATPPADPTGPPPWPGAPTAVAPAVRRRSARRQPRRRLRRAAPPGAWKQFVAGALIGALVGGATAGGVYLATKDDTRRDTVVVQRNVTETGSTRNTSSIAQPHGHPGHPREGRARGRRDPHRRRGRPATAARAAAPAPGS